MKAPCVLVLVLVLGFVGATACAQSPCDPPRSPVPAICAPTVIYVPVPVKQYVEVEVQKKSEPLGPFGLFTLSQTCEKAAGSAARKEQVKFLGIPIVCRKYTDEKYKELRPVSPRSCP